MSISRVVILLAPFGAAGLIVNFFVSYSAFLTLQNSIVPGGTSAGTKVGLAGYAAGGLIGSVVLSLTVIVAACHHWPRNSRVPLILAGSLAVIAAILIGFGNAGLSRALETAARAESPSNLEKFVADVHSAFTPGVAGAIGLSVALLAFAAAAFFAKEGFRPGVRWLLFPTIGASLILVGASVVQLVSLMQYEGALASPTMVHPADLASSITRITIAVYLAVFGVAGLGVVIALLGASTSDNNSESYL